MTGRPPDLPCFEISPPLRFGFAPGIERASSRVKDELVRRAAAAEEQARGPIILAGVENADLTRILRQAQDAGPGGAAEHKRSDKTARRVKEFRDEAVELVRTVRLRTRNDLFWAGVK
jgi:hypothetical protein